MPPDPNSGSSNTQSSNTSPSPPVEGIDFSGQPEAKIYVRFINTTKNSVDLIWLDQAGEKILVQTLLPQSSVAVFTYHSHPWIFLDHESKERLAVSKGNIGRCRFFEGGDFLRALSVRPDYPPDLIGNLGSGRGLILACIEPALDSLRLLTLKSLRSSIKHKEDCFRLDVPDQMQFELAQTFL